MLYAPTHLKQALWVLILAVMALAIACGSGEPAATTAPSQPSPTATTQPDSPPAHTAPSTEIPAATDDASPAQPEITSTPAGERGTPPERPQTRSEPKPVPQPETPTSEEPTALPSPTAIPAAAVPANTPAATSEHLYQETSAATDRTVLELLYEQTKGDRWNNNENWMTEKPLGDWYGITTNSQGRVRSITFFDNNLEVDFNRKGIPPEIGNLSHLKLLSISAGSIEGEIPVEIANLSQLTHLALNGLGLTGHIPPEIGNLTNLTFLDLGGNDLSGKIPPELGKLAKLEVLGLATNYLGVDLTTGERTGVPEELGNLTSLTAIFILPQPRMANACIPAKLKGQLRTDLPSHYVLTPFCEE